MKRSPIGWLIVIGIFIIGFIIGDIQIKIGKDTTEMSPKEIEKDLMTLQDITGSLFRSPGESLEREVSAFASTKGHLDLRTYEFTQKEFKSLLKRLATDGVEIRIIVEDDKFQQFQNTLKVLTQYYSGEKNIQLRSDRQMGTRYTHAKVNLIDSGFIIQTANLTHSAFAANREYFFQAEDAGIQRSLHTIFEKDRKGEPITSKDIHPNLVICNINCRGVIERLLNSAQESIIIQTQYITDNGIRNILKTKKNLPEFKLLVADTDDNDELIRFFGNEQARKFKRYYNHAKMILIDHKLLLLGSMNLSSTSLDENREIGILLLDTGIVNQFSDRFDQDRTASNL